MLTNGTDNEDAGLKTSAVPVEASSADLTVAELIELLKAFRAANPLPQDVTIRTLIGEGRE